MSFARGAIELGGPVRIVRVTAEPLSVPLLDPFVIASATVTSTRAALVRVELERAGLRAIGLGEAAALPGVTREDQGDLLAQIAAAAPLLEGRTLSTAPALSPVLDASLPHAPVARAGVESALLDAWARLAGAPLYECLGPRHRARPVLDTDITLPIGEPAAMAAQAERHAALGFRVFKVKVGLDLDADRAALVLVAERVPGARFRLDANGGFDARTALALLDHARSASLAIECFEQPCHRDDLAGMAEVTASAGLPVIADESVRDEADLERVLDARAASGVNLKLVKSGGLVAALALGLRARDEGLALMAGAMVETRLGLTAMAHVVAALGGVDYVDLDTALLLAAEPFRGGHRQDGPRIELSGGPGLDIDPA